MWKQPDDEATLSCVATIPDAEQQATSLWLTIVFHPDTSRIGECVCLEPVEQVGRFTPLFSAWGQGVAGSGLGEAHVSRRAFEVSRCAEGVELMRPPGASRLRLPCGDVGDKMALSPEALRAGVAMMLGHSVVLLLSLEVVAGAGSLSAPPRDFELYGCSPYLANLYQSIVRAARQPGDILLRGASGTGKELVARAIHAHTPTRQRGPLVAVNMAAVPSGLAAAALFGSEKGAYTGANARQLGYFQQADGGTLFLDEIGDTPAEIQPLLLRALQQREVQALGGAVETVDLRVISATDVDIDASDSRFRAALRYRLSAYQVELESLSEHRQDVGILLWQKLQSALASMGMEALLPQRDSSPMNLARWAELFFQASVQSWPGNVRQLENVALQLAANSNEVLAGFESVYRLEQPVRPASTRRMKDFDDSEFYRAYEQAQFEIAETARTLGVSRQAVYRRIERSVDLRLVGDIADEELSAALLASGQDVVRAARLLKVSSSSLRNRLNQL